MRLRRIAEGFLVLTVLCHYAIAYNLSGQCTALRAQADDKEEKKWHCSRI